MDVCPEYVNGKITFMIIGGYAGGYFIPVASVYTKAVMQNSPCPIGDVDLCGLDEDFEYDGWSYIQPGNTSFNIDGWQYRESIVDLPNTTDNLRIYFILYLNQGYASSGAAIAPIYTRVQPESPCIESESECDGCLSGFAPTSTGHYIVNAWAKEDNAPNSATTYTDPHLSLNSLDAAGQVIATELATPSGPIIDGWQRIEKTFTMAPGAAKFQVQFGTSGGPVYFDDIRIFPADGSMKCYVYDPENLRFVAELDERHFATFYEYDNEGNLVRVKKETERGIKTLNETRQNAPHLEVQ